MIGFPDSWQEGQAVLTQNQPSQARLNSAGRCSVQSPSPSRRHLTQGQPSQERSGTGVSPSLSRWPCLSSEGEGMWLVPRGMAFPQICPCPCAARGRRAPRYQQLGCMQVSRLPSVPSIPYSSCQYTQPPLFAAICCGIVFTLLSIPFQMDHEEKKNLARLSQVSGGGGDFP